MLNARQEEHVTDYPDVRVFTAARKGSQEPLYDLDEVTQPWSLPTKDSIGMYDDRTYFSAVCWLFGRHLNQRLGYPTGEANIPAPETYNCTFPAMITDWRSKFNAGSKDQTDTMFPFGFVQLGPFRKPDPANPVTTGIPDIRWHQTADVGVVPNNKMQRVFMAVAMDLPDYDSPYGSVHLGDKSTIGQRLVRSGLAVAYSWKIKFQSPQISAYYINKDFFTLDLEFDNKSTPLDIREKDGFEVCCSHDNLTYCVRPGTDWVSVPISKVVEGIITLDYKACTSMFIVGLRYAWRESPCDYMKCAIYTKEEGIPLAPFFKIGLIGLSTKDRSIHM